MGFIVLASLPTWGIGMENCKKIVIQLKRKSFVITVGINLERPGGHMEKYPTKSIQTKK